MKIIKKLLESDFIKYLLGAILIIVPLYPKFPLFSVPGTYVAIRFEDLLLLLLGIITFVKIATDYKKFFKDPLVIAFVFYFAIGLLSLISGIFLTKTVNLNVGLLNYLRRLEYLIPFFAVFTLFNKKKLLSSLGYFYKILIIVTIVAFIYGLGQRYFAYPIIITQNDQYSKGVALRWTPGSHISSTFAGHYDLAAFMVMLLPIFVGLFFTIKNNWNRLWLGLAIIGSYWLLINSLSRISQLAYLVSVGILLMLLKKYKALALVLVVSVVLIGMSSSLNQRFMRVFDVYKLKIKLPKAVYVFSDFKVKAETEVLPQLRTNLPKPTSAPAPVFEDRSTSIRLNVEWPRALRAFKINPMLGTGYSSITLATDNDFLRMLGETGLLGLAAFALIFLRIVKTFISNYKQINKMDILEKVFVIGTFAAIVGTFISATFIDLFEASKFATIFWFMIAMALGIIKNNNEQNN